ncbi:hypothetical protein A0256_10785 [Mucilaginibacter sp. PAMC 26640]|nr:hypothetical protein A0256_10785 [Mucilaginibacter sp. PAMC 26640]
MKKLTVVILLSLIAASSFSQGVNSERPLQQPENIIKNYGSFFSYVNEHMKLSQDLVAYDVKGRLISKASFLKALTTGYYLPLRLGTADTKMHYRLFKLNALSAKDMGVYIKGWSRVVYTHYLQEGKQFSPFEFVDLKGNKYSTANTRGKILLVNCWFIGCANCEKEMPALNQLVKKYADRKDVVFLSLALDTKAKLVPFLKRKRFDYAIVPGQEKFINSSLKTSAYPTHFVINKTGKIVSVVDTPEEVIYALKTRL